MKGMKSFQKLALFATAAVFCSFSALSLSACGPSNEEIVREGLTSELEGIKTLDPEYLDEIIGSSATELANYGIDADAFYRAYLEGFDYTINSVEVTGDVAVANVDITCKKLGDALDTFTADFLALYEDDSLLELSEDELNAKIGEAFNDAVAATPLSTTTVDLEYNLVDNAWTPAASFNTAIEEAMVGDLSGLQ